MRCHICQIGAWQMKTAYFNLKLTDEKSIDSVIEGNRGNLTRDPCISLMMLLICREKWFY